MRTGARPVSLDIVFGHEVAERSRIARVYPGLQFAGRQETNPVRLATNGPDTARQETPESVFDHAGQRAVFGCSPLLGLPYQIVVEVQGSAHADEHTTGYRHLPSRVGCP